MKNSEAHESLKEKLIELESRCENLKNELEQTKQQLQEVEKKFSLLNIGETSTTVSDVGSSESTNVTLNSIVNEIKDVKKILEDPHFRKPTCAIQSESSLSSQTIPLLPHKTLQVDREGYSHAVSRCTQGAFVRNMLTLVFDFDELMHATLKGKEGLKPKKCLDSERVDYIIDAAQFHYPESEISRPKLERIIGIKLYEINSGILTEMDKKKWIGFTKFKYAVAWQAQCRKKKFNTQSPTEESQSPTEESQSEPSNSSVPEDHN